MRSSARVVRIEMCEECDVASLMQFIDRQWAPNHVMSRDERLLRWQFDPSLGDRRERTAPSILVAWDRDRIVGMLGITYMRWLQQGTVYPGAWNSHWFVAPEMRQSQLAFLLLRHTTRLGVDVIGGVGVAPSAVGILRNLGYDTVDEIPRWVGIIDAASTAALLHAVADQTTRHLDLESYCRERVVDASGFADSSEWRVTPWQPDDLSGWDLCWAEHIAREFTGVVRDGAYIRWRYLDHPSFEYVVSVARHRDSGRIGGLTVARLETVRGRSERVLRICELLASSSAVSERLLRHLIEHARVNGVAFADFYCSQSQASLRAAGFQRETVRDGAVTLPSRLQPLEAGGRAINAAIRLPAALRGSLGRLSARGAVYLTKSDGDQDRPN